MSDLDFDLNAPAAPSLTLDAALGFCRSALTLTLMHMEHAPSFSARPDKHCQWCPYSGLCSI